LSVDYGFPLLAKENFDRRILKNGLPPRDRKKIADRLADGDYGATEFSVGPEGLGDIPG